MTSDAILAKALTAIPVEPCSIPVCDRPAAAVVRQEDGAVFLVCERHLEKATAYGFAIVRPGEEAPASERHELGDARAGVGDPAPEIRLPSLGPTGLGEVVPVSEVAHGRPVALAFGSYSAPKFRRNLPGVEDVHRRYADRVSLFLVYTQEVRPAGAPVQASGRFPGAPATIEERAAQARRLVDEFQLSVPVLLDRLDHEVTRAYGGFPLRLTLIGRSGRIVYQPPLGPYAFRPDELAAAIEQELS